MANKRVPDFPALITPAPDDKLYIVDTSDTTDDPSGSSKHIDYSNLVSGVVQDGANVGSEGAEVFKSKNGQTLEFRKIVAGDNMVVTQNADTIEVKSTAMGDGEIVDHTFTSNADFNANGSEFSAGMLNPVINDRLEIALEDGQFVDNFDNTSGISGANSSNLNVDNGLVSMAKVIDPGTGNDGSVTISTNKNINSDTIASGRSVADGINFNVTQLTSASATLDTTPTAGALGVGDEILLISLQGYSGQTGNVGNYEFLRILSVAGDVVTFTTPKTKVYGDGSGDLNLGTGSNKHKVVLQRVPNYNNATISNGVTLTCNAWDGVKGGIVAFRCAGTLTLSGTIDVSAKGWRAGISSARSGESIVPRIDSAVTQNHSGGGGATSVDSNNGGGGGHFAAGSNGINSNGGDPLGNSNLTQIFFGGAGGIRGDIPGGVGTGHGGGLIFVGATGFVINATGMLSSQGGTGNSNSGRGSGGTIFAQSVDLSIFNTTVNVASGSGAGAEGSVGRVLFKYQTLVDGTLYSGSHINNVQSSGIYATSATLQSINVVSGKTVDSIEEFVANVTAKPGGATLTVQFSQNATDWFNSTGTPGGTNNLIAGTTTLDLSALSWSGPNFYYRIAFGGTGAATPELDAVTLNYSPDAYTSGPQQWTSPEIGSSTTSRLPTEFEANWTDDGDAPAPKFQIQGSDSGLFAGEQDTFPATGQFYQTGTAFDIDNGIPLDLESHVFTSRKFWKLIVVLDAGPELTTAPTVESLDFKVKITSNINTSPAERLYAFHTLF